MPEGRNSGGARAVKVPPDGGIISPTDIPEKGATWGIAFERSFINSARKHHVKLEYLGRYLFAADYLRRYRLEQVADIACGTSYGLPELTQTAQAVVLVMVLGQADVPRIGDIAMLINVLLP